MEYELPNAKKRNSLIYLFVKASLVYRVQFTDFRISHTKGNTTCTFLFTVDLINFNSMLPARYKQWTFWHDGNSSFQINDIFMRYLCVFNMLCTALQSGPSLQQYALWNVIKGREREKCFI